MPCLLADDSHDSKARFLQKSQGPKVHPFVLDVETIYGTNFRTIFSFEEITDKLLFASHVETCMYYLIRCICARII